MAMVWMAADTVVGGAVAVVVATVVATAELESGAAPVVGVGVAAGVVVLSARAGVVADATDVWLPRASSPARMLCSTAPAWGLASASPTTLTMMATDSVPATQRVVRRRRRRSSPLAR